MTGMRLSVARERDGTELSAVRIIAFCIFLAGMPAVSTGPALAGDGRQPVRFQYTELHMGVQARITLYAGDEAAALSAARAAFARIAELEDIFSDYRPGSELMRLCAAAGGPPRRVSRELFEVLEFAQRLSRLSGGAFDVTCGPAVRLWREARRSQSFPALGDLRRARALVDWRALELFPETRSVRLRKEGMLLDLGGIAKGYACDEAIRVLRRCGIRSALIEMGGDIVASGPPPGQPGWRIELPNAPDAERVLILVNGAVSSSGDTEQFVELDGKRYSHIVDPRSALALTSRIAVTVQAPRGMLSDALSTAVSVLGEGEGRRLLSHFSGARLWVRTAP
jgi:thiamine biosynthesis lipoprotein